MDWRLAESHSSCSRRTHLIEPSLERTVDDVVRAAVSARAQRFRNVIFLFRGELEGHAPKSGGFAIWCQPCVGARRIDNYARGPVEPVRHEVKTYRSAAMNLSMVIPD